MIKIVFFNHSVSDTRIGWNRLKLEAQFTVRKHLLYPEETIRAELEQHMDNGKRGDGFECVKMKLKLLNFRCVNSILIEGNKIIVFLYLPLSSC